MDVLLKYEYQLNKDPYIYILFFFKQVYMLPVNFLRVTSYHIYPVKRVFDSSYCQSS